MNNNLLLIGCGGHARSIIDILETSTEYNISGLVGMEKELGKKVFNYSIIGKDSDLLQLRKIYSNAFIATGQIPFAQIRIKIANLLKELKYEMVDFHSSRPGHDLRYSLSGEKMKKLGWTPSIKLTQRIKQVVDWSLKNDNWIEL